MEIDFDPIRDIEELECLLVDDPVTVLRVFDAPLGHSNSISRSFDVTFSNSLFDFNDDYNLCYDNPFFNEELEDISSLDPLESTPVIDESSLLVTPLSDPTIPYDLEDLRACFQSSNHAIPSGESKVHIEVLLVLWGNRLPIPNGSLPLS
ncbi:hypothetical protein Tco_1486007, partial [Tanacetum coccineum]